MATYTIVASNATLGPGEVHAGQTLGVSAGDVFIVDASADEDVKFVAAGGGPHDFDVVFNATLASALQVTIGENLSPSVTIADNVDLGGVDLAAAASTGLTLNVGNNAHLGKLDGSSAGADTITIGDGFTAHGDWNTTGGADVITVGDGATFLKLKTGKGDDSVTIGDGASFDEIATEDGNDTVWLGDNATGNKLLAGSHDDTIVTGAHAQITTVDGESGIDSYTTQTGGTTPSNMETMLIVCFLQATNIRTRHGVRAVETLRVGDAVWTLDHGFQPLRWIGRFDVGQERLRRDPSAHPVRVRAGALGPAVPRRDLFVSQQHRLLVRSRIAQRMFRTSEVLIAAKKLIGAPGIEIVPAADPITYFHLVLDRHAIVDANGAQTETMAIAPQAVLGLSEAGRQAIAAGIGREDASAPLHPFARPIIHKRCLCDKLVARAVGNGKPLQEAPGAGVAA